MENLTLQDLQNEISAIDNLFARMPALADLPNRVDKINKAISTADTADELRRELEAAHNKIKSLKNKLRTLKNYFPNGDEMLFSLW